MTTPHPLMLIVDDDEDLSELVRMTCEQLGLRAHVVPNTVEARKWLEAHKPDMVFMDIMMPDGNGLDLCRWIRGQDKFAQIPVIISSGLDDDETLQDAMEIGAVDFVQKPFGVNVLIEKITRLLPKSP